MNKRRRRSMIVMLLFGLALKDKRTKKSGFQNKFQNGKHGGRSGW